MLKKIVLSSKFSNFIMTVVLINSIVLGLQTSPDIVNATGDVLTIIDKVCLYIFVVEAILKITALRLGYFKSGWNWFDFIIVLASLASDIPAFSSLRALRIIRIVRALKFISGIEHLQIIVSAIGRAVPSIGWTALLMLLIYYVFAVIGTMLFGEAFPAWFGSVGKSMYSLFQVMTLESWSMGISRPVMAVYPYAWAYFVPFVIMSSYVILNIVVGIVVNSIGEVTAEREKEIRESIDSIPEKVESIKRNLEDIEKFIEGMKSDK